MRELPPLLLLAVALILTLAWRQYRRQRNQEALNDAAPLRTLLTEVKTKREFLRSRSRSREHQVMMPEAWRYEATFRPLQGGADITLRLSASDYHQLDKGMRGMLQVKGTRFVGFTPRLT
ncbi:MULTISPECIES: DUF2500 domain-containing protein [unclassified Brenneria]|uniref:DUF2500 domain-containing protein n=1 Tax=unclassified Brenneria TaxID=2634434 RepID=UPI001554BB31|nr:MULTISPECIES: DUF2500 domain-containing protein [unclassified Brenneria]MBJ7222100.1 DUF2500 domain-containing protein [Brenneria sp. L3-3C-1]MEE3643344.1 DUF2500 domain-containing protein [Brenneria sp. L3_3C_1]MEE3651529.1 DUF2500 domain-containing protein [Brenneria sp. HEZEL_4_2_4]NPD01485.1 DUF2500 domain-containing protein [Brenneria sp. hezel4-2-4]